MSTTHTEMIRVLVTMPPDWKAAFQARAQSDGKSLSEFLRDAAASQLTKKQQKTLSEITERRGRPAS